MNSAKSWKSPRFCLGGLAFFPTTLRCVGSRFECIPSSSSPLLLTSSHHIASHHANPVVHACTKAHSHASHHITSHHTHAHKHTRRTSRICADHARSHESDTPITLSERIRRETLRFNSAKSRNGSRFCMGDLAFFKQSMHFAAAWWHRCASLPREIPTYFGNTQTSNLKCLLFSSNHGISHELNTPITLSVIIFR